LYLPVRVPAAIGGHDLGRKPCYVPREIVGPARDLTGRDFSQNRPQTSDVRVLARFVALTG